MDELFTRFGLSQKEAKAYSILLAKGSLTATQLARESGESRTNSYMILEKLDRASLVVLDETKAVRRYEAADPSNLQKNLLAKQQDLRKTQQALNKTLPELKSLYNLNKFKPGVVYLEGLKGLEIMLDDIAKSQEEALLIPGGLIRGEAWETLKKGIAKRATQGVRTRALFTEVERTNVDKELHKKQRYEVRYWNGKPYPGEMVIYGNKCVFTAYEPELINTIITNDAIANTLRAVFEGLWRAGKP